MSKDLTSEDPKSLRLTKLAHCAGCGAKLGAGELARLLGNVSFVHDPNLLVGFDTKDDAAVYKLDEKRALIQTIDFFPPIADDPYWFGQIAAANALSDIYAMGGEPVLALNVMALTEDLPDHAIQEILRGGAEKVAEAGASLAGGHSIYTQEPIYGLSVTGLVDLDLVKTNAGAKPQDRLILTKPLGVGILVGAAKESLLEQDVVMRCLKQMATLNKAARDCMVRYQVHAVTDVTGFSLLGHAVEMAEASGVAITIDSTQLKFTADVHAWARLGLLPAGTYRNRKFAEPYCDFSNVSRDMVDVLFSPETSGGLLIAVAEEDADALLQDLITNKDVPAAFPVGWVEAYNKNNHAAKRVHLIA